MPSLKPPPTNDTWEDPSADLEDDNEPPWEPPIATVRKVSIPQNGGKVTTKPPPLTTSLYPTRPKSNGGNSHDGANDTSKGTPSRAQKNDFGDNGTRHIMEKKSNDDSVTYSPPPPEDPPGPPSTLYITLRRSGDMVSDFAKLSRLHRMLCSQVGGDHFVVVLEGAGQSSVELSFPNESTCYTHSLRERVLGIVGEGNLRVVMSA